MQLEGTSLYPGTIRDAVRRLGGAGTMLKKVPEHLDKDLEALDEIFDTYRAQFELIEETMKADPDLAEPVEQNKIRMITGSTLISSVREQVEKLGGSVSDALARILAEHIRIVELVDTPETRKSVSDIARIIEHILIAYLGREERPEPSGIVIAEELSLPDLHLLFESPATGIALQTETSGLEAEAAARILRVPTVKGLSGLFETVQENETVDLDADKGILTLERDA